MSHRQKYPYAMRRMAAHFIPIAHLQRAPYSIHTEPIQLSTTDEVTIAATLFPRRRDRLVVICHGFGANQRTSAIVWLAEQLAGSHDVLTFDWRGYGASGGLASMGGAEALDLTAVLAMARSRGYRRVAVVAESMGGLITLATLGAAARKVGFPMPDALAAVSAPADYAFTGGPRPQLVQHVAPVSWLRPLAPLLGFRLGEVHVPKPLEVVAQIDIPMLIAHGDRDEIVPVRNAYLLGGQQPNATMRIYRDVDHAIPAMRAQNARIFLRDLHELLASMG
jgi:pimeloyl-ACP methyl ester carboxylesterase